MKFQHTIVAFIISVISVPGMAQEKKGQIVFMEHSIRWIDESNFPYYLKFPDVENEIMQGINKSFTTKFGYKLGENSYKIDYRVIDMFGKAKLKWPKQMIKGTDEVAILSSMTRTTIGFGILWKMQINIRNGANVIFSKEVEHELEPVSVSVYMTKQRWLSAEEFASLFVSLIDETLGVLPAQPSIISVGSRPSPESKVSAIFPIKNHYNLSIAGAMMREQNSSYELKKESVAMERLIYKEGWETVSTKGAVWSGLLSDIFSQISGLSVQFEFKTKIENRGRLENTSGNKTKLRMGWLERKKGVTIGSVEVGTNQIISPMAVEMFNDKDDVYASFIYYKQLNTNNEELTKKNFKMQGTKGTLGISDTHIITGQYKGKQFDVIYPEQEGIVVLYSDKLPIAALSMINENKESRSFAGMTLSKNKGSQVGTQGAFKKIDPSSKTAEIYSLYTSEELNDDLTKESVQLYVLLFFAIAQALEQSSLDPVNDN
jgi:hypothetical protein